MSRAKLEIEGLEIDYDGYQVVRGVDLTVREGETVVLLGPNGAGKSSLVNSVSGLVQHRKGSIRLDGHDIGSMPAHRRTAAGLAHVLERRRVFPHHTVQENLILGSYLPGPRSRRQDSLDFVLAVFPALRDRLRARAGLLSGGQQQQLAIARGLMSRPTMLMLDEPFLGLSPSVVADISAAMRLLREQGITILFIEHNVDRALQMADRGYILESGRMAVTGTREELLQHERVLEVYLGSAAPA